MNQERGLVFISCGQVTPQEKKLGDGVAAIVRELSQLVPYLAENQSSLDGFTKNILGALNRAVALIAIMHPRGKVSLLGGKAETRASVWIEQEIAMAAYITQVLGRPISIAAYIHDEVRREGMREQLQLNAVRFREDAEVLRHLRSLLPTWSDLSAPLKPSDTERQNIVSTEISKLEKPGKEALRLLLAFGSLTDYAAVIKLQPLGASVGSVLPGLQNMSGLVQPVPGQPSARRPEYELNWEIKPELRPFVQEYFENEKG